MIGSVLAFVVARPILGHCLIALALMAILLPLLRALRAPGYGWHAAALTSVYFYAREAAQAERALKPALGDPGAYFRTLWPGGWTAGGNLWEWLAPTAVALALGFLAQRRW